MPVETTINTIRHAQTAYGSEKRYAGTIDVPLDEKGVRDSSIAAELLKAIKFDIVVSSGMRRALETARILSGGRIPIIKTKLCRERNFGTMEGCTWDEVQNFDPPILFISVGNDLHSVNPRGGEPFEDVWQRAKAFRRFLFKNYAGKNTLVVSHGVFLQVFHGVLRGLSCIESLVSYPRSLEMTSFLFSNDRLIQERVWNLMNSSKPDF